MDDAVSSYTIIMTLDWREEAACRNLDPVVFFPAPGQGHDVDTREAKAICHGCEVKPECLQYALTTGQESGVWGGMDEKERRREQRRLRLSNRGHPLRQVI